MIHPSDLTGVNETHLLVTGEVGLLTHVSCFQDDDLHRELHYYATSFLFDPGSSEFRDLKIIASRNQFGDGPAKRKELVDVVFPSGLVRTNETVTLYAGVSDTETHGDR